MISSIMSMEPLPVFFFSVVQCPGAKASFFHLFPRCAHITCIHILHGAPIHRLESYILERFSIDREATSKQCSGL